MPAETVIKLRRGTASQWTTANPVLAAGEMGVETDTYKSKFGNGTTAWTSLPYSATGSGGTTASDTPPSSPEVGDIWWNSATSKIFIYFDSYWVDLSQAGLGGATSFEGAQSHNYIINGAFDFWQRGTSLGNGTTVYDTRYLADRWLCDDGIGGSFIVSQQAFAVGQTDVPSNPTYFHRVDFPSTAGTGNQSIQQRIENVSTLASQTATLSFWVKGTMNGSFTPSVVQSFGSGGSSDVATNGDTFTISPTWTKIVRSYSVPSISGKTVGAGNYLSVKINFPNSQLGQVDIANVQLEEGFTSTPFRRNSPNLQAELAACQRYYQKVQNGHTAAGAIKATNSATVFWRLETVMRAAFSYTLDTQSLVVPGYVFSADITSVSVSSITSTSMAVQVFWVGDPTTIPIGTPASLQGILAADAEL